VNTGGGGGGSGWNGSIGAAGGAGGSGVIIIKIPDALIATFSGGVTSSGGSPSGGFRVYTVTAAGPTDTVTFN
jgi:hypothetical protein